MHRVISQEAIEQEVAIAKHNIIQANKGLLHPVEFLGWEIDIDESRKYDRVVMRYTDGDGKRQLYNIAF